MCARARESERNGERERGERSIQFDKEAKLVSCFFYKPQIQEKWF